MHVRIYCPARNTMQSGRAKAKAWVLEAEPMSGRAPEPLMGWTAAGDTLGEVTLKFPTADAAIKYAQKQGWQYTVTPAQGRKLTPRNYADNFRK